MNKYILMLLKAPENTIMHVDCPVVVEASSPENAVEYYIDEDNQFAIGDKYQVGVWNANAPDEVYTYKVRNTVKRKICKSQSKSCAPDVEQPSSTT